MAGNGQSHIHPSLSAIAILVLVERLLTIIVRMLLAVKNMQNMCPYSKMAAFRNGRKKARVEAVVINIFCIKNSGLVLFLGKITRQFAQNKAIAST